jgi:hypothetical protein
MANVFYPMSSGIDPDWGSLGTANSVALQRASGKGSREEIALRAAVNHKSEE